ncbi:hypothetical protein FVF58_09410 [Paraburkholderia panacisoli]|uniref:Uncharacterized protein n=1 Tax=Paraburkholderia panacisoli TaxID=2603818 RepID=A0A5B0HD87_9BURK|nr:hypothetical protein [Paraburkholderia panacisoli]KAA1012998.1 hypothetical protein FVF58_09410 [Paraburkholderia panacisoli]
MSRSQKPRKKYNPTRWLNRAIVANEKRMDTKPLNEQRQNEIALGHHLSFEALMRCPTEEAWYDLAGNLNMALILCERGHGGEYIDDIKKAMIGMMRAKYRSDRTGSYALDADAIQSLKTALAVHDAQLEVAERSELRAAAKTIVGRANNGDIYADFQMKEAA